MRGGGVRGRLGFRKVPRTSGIPFGTVVPWEDASDALPDCERKLPGERRRDPAEGQTVVRRASLGAGNGPRLKPGAGYGNGGGVPAGGRAGEG